jgi:hypothetical protein
MIVVDTNIVTDHGLLEEKGDENHEIGQEAEVDVGDHVLGVVDIGGLDPETVDTRIYFLLFIYIFYYLYLYFFLLFIIFLLLYSLFSFFFKKK